MVKGTVHRCVRLISYLDERHRAVMDEYLKYSKNLRFGAVFRDGLICISKEGLQSLKELECHRQFLAGRLWLE